MSLGLLKRARYILFILLLLLRVTAVIPKVIYRTVHWKCLKFVRSLIIVWCHVWHFLRYRQFEEKEDNFYFMRQHVMFYTFKRNEIYKKNNATIIIMHPSI